MENDAIKLYISIAIKWKLKGKRGEYDLIQRDIFKLASYLIRVDIVMSRNNVAECKIDTN